jgi:hypothetical protein
VAKKRKTAIFGHTWRIVEKHVKNDKTTREWKEERGREE